MNFKLYGLPAHRLPLVNQRIFKINEPVINRFKANDSKTTITEILKSCGYFWEQWVFLLFGLSFTNKNPTIRFLNFFLFYFTLFLCVFYLTAMVICCVLYGFDIVTTLLPSLICIYRIIISIFFLQNQSKVFKLDQDLNILLHSKVLGNQILLITIHAPTNQFISSFFL